MKKKQHTGGLTNRQWRRSSWITIVSWVVETGTIHSQIGQEIDQTATQSSVNTTTFCYQIQPVEGVEDHRARLMNDTYDSATGLGQPLQKRNALQARRAVKSAARRGRIEKVALITSNASS